MRSGDGDGSVDIEPAGGEIDHRGGDDAEIEDIGSGLHRPAGEAFEEYG